MVKHSEESLTLQSAMEYLMTYGWAILIIAVVLGALFQLGIFNASTFTPKAPPGACHVFRPNGPGTTSFINTQGICNGELPQYVALFSNPSKTSISIPSSNFPIGTNSLTITAWFRTTQKQVYPYLLSYGSGSANTVIMGVYDGDVYFDSGGNGYPIIINAADNAWHFAVVSLVGGTGGITVCLDSTCSTSSLAIIPKIQGTSTGMIGGGGTNYFDGSISNIQFYNTTLTSNEISALHNEGIGGAPIKLNNLVGWWPLNGDTKDYSGNNYNGAASGITFTSNWESGYSAP